MHIATSRQLFSALVLWGCFIFFAASAAAEHRPKVLFLNSYHHGFAWSDRIVDGAREVFENSGLDLDLSIEYLDTKRWSPEELSPYLMPLYRHKYRDEHFEVILTSDNTAFDFALRLRQELFPTTPIVFCGLNDYDERLREEHIAITGVAESFDIQGTLSLALKLHPQVTTVAFLSDSTASGKLNLEKVQELMPDFPPALNILQFGDLSSQELQKKLLELPEESVILYLAFYRDREGNTYSLQESVGFIRRYSDAPIYTLWDYMIVPGMVGGLVTYGREQGRNAAEMVVRILDGEKADEIPVLEESPNVPMFDYQQLLRFTLQPAQLPEGSIIVNEPDSLYYRYKNFLWGILSFVLFQTLALFALGVNIAQRRKAELSLKQRNALLYEQTKENARLFEAEARRFREAETLRLTIQAVSSTLDLQEVFERILSELQRVVPYDSASVQQIDDESLEIIGGRGFPAFDTLRGVRFALHDSNNPNQRVIHERKALILQDAPKQYAQFHHGPHLQADIRSWLGVPLVFGDRILGMIALDKQDAGFYTEEHARLAQAFAGQAAIAIENARIFSELKERDRALLELNEQLEQRVEQRTYELRAANTALEQSLTSLREAQYQLILSEKMSALGGLVAGVAHEINTPLGVGVTAASHLEEKTREADRFYQEGQLKRSSLERYFKTAIESSRIILENLRRACEHVQSFKQVAVDQSSELRRDFFLKEYIDNVLLSLRPRVKKTTHTIRVDCPEELMIHSYPGVFSQILTNFIMNSLLHGFETKENGEILIKVSSDANALELRYSDNGIGISPEALPKIFDPFFTTKRGQGGSGLGLHIVYNLVTQKLHASITCDSQPNQGARFTLRIPWEDIH